MPRIDVVASVLSAVLAALALAGLVARRKVEACWLFPAYLASAVACHASVVVAPERFWNWGFWAATDVVHTALRMGIALEITLRTFRPFPRGLHHMRVALLFVMLATAIAVVMYPREYGDAFELSLVVGRVSYGVAIMFTAFLLVVRHYGVPVDPLHRAIAAGFAVASALLAFASAFSADFEGGTSLLTKIAYPVVLAGWTVSAWRRDAFTGLSPAAVGVLWPWRQR